VDSTIFIDRTNAGKQEFSTRFAKRDKAPYVPSTFLRMHAYIDVSSVELFIDDGRVVLTEIFFPTEDFGRTDIFVSGGVTELQSAVVYSLEGIY
jgi:fructan beta-fructosidase